MPAQIGLEVYKSNLLSRLSTLLIWLWILGSLQHFCKNLFNGSCAVFSYYSQSLTFLSEYRYASFPHNQFLQSLLVLAFIFVKFLKFVNSSSDLVHIMNITSMNYKKRMDLSLIRELMHFFSNFHMYCCCKDFPHGATFFELKLPYRITARGAC